MADISKIMLPNGIEYDIKDVIARNKSMVSCTCLDSSGDQSDKILTINDSSITSTFFETLPVYTPVPVMVEFLADNSVVTNVRFKFEDGSEYYQIFYDGQASSTISDARLAGQRGSIVYTFMRTPNAMQPSRSYAYFYYNGVLHAQSDWNVTDTTSDAFIKNKPTIPVDDGLNARLTGDTAITDGDDLDDYTTPGEYRFIKMTMPATSVVNAPADCSFRLRVENVITSIGDPYKRQIFYPSDDTSFYIRYSYRDTTTPTWSAWSDWERFSPNVQSDWNVSDSSSDAFIKNKPTIPTIESQFTLSIATTDWSSTTTTVNSIPYYTATITASNLVKEYPTIYCGSSSTLPSAQEKDAFNLINYAIADLTNHTITFYAVIKPTIALTINVIG